MSDDSFRIKNKKRKKKDKRILFGDKRILFGDKVEVLYLDEGLKGSWHAGMVIDCSRNSRLIRYTNLLGDDNQKLVELVQVSSVVEGMTTKNPINFRGNIRPSPPHYGIQGSEIKYGLCVDALVDDAWWEGVVFDHEEGAAKRLVFFPDQGDQHTITVDCLRLTQEWNEDSGHWKSRGEWLFLQVLQTFEHEDALPVSIRQIWYDLRTMADFVDKIGIWIFGPLSVWQELVSKLIQELQSVVYGQPVLSQVPMSNVGVDIPMEDFLCLESTDYHMDRPGSYTGLTVIINDSHRSEIHNHCLSGCAESSSPWVYADKNCSCLATEDEFIKASGEGDCGNATSLLSDSNKLHLKPDALSDFIIEYRNRVSPCPPDFRERLRVKQEVAQSHLVAVGWEFKINRYGSKRYVSPDGKQYGSFITACEAREEVEKDLLFQKTKNCDGADDDMICHDQGAEANRNVVHRGSNDEGITASGVANSWQPVELEGEYCADATTLFARGLEDGKRELKNLKTTDLNSNDIRFKVRKHLLALGWKIECKRDKILRVRYCSPDGKKYYSLHKVLLYLMTGHQKDQMCRDDNSFDGDHLGCKLYGLLRAKVHPEPLSLPQDSLVHSSSMKNKRTKDSIYALALPVPMENLRMNRLHTERCRPSDEMVGSHGILDPDILEVSSPKVLQQQRHTDGDCFTSGEQYPEVEVSDKNVPVKEDLEALYCPEAVIEYKDRIESGKTKGKKDHLDASPKLKILNAKKHLLSMGWRFWLKTKKTKQELCYRSPNGKSFYSLYTACKAYLEAEENLDNTVAKLCEGMTISTNSEALSANPKFEDSIRRRSKCRLSSCCTTIRSAEFQEAAQALHGGAGKASTLSTNSVEYEELRFDKVRFEKCSKSKQRSASFPFGALHDRIRHTPRFFSSGQLTKRKASQAFLRQGVESGISSSSHVLRPSKRSHQVMVSSPSKLISRMLRYPSDCSSNCQRVGKRKASQGVIKKGHGSRNSSSCRVLRSSKRSRQLVVLSPNQHSARTVLSWLIDNDVVLPRQKIIYKRDGRVMMEGQMSRNGIRCNCCRKVYSLTDFGLHAGNSNHRPAANIYLQDGRSLLECQMQIVHAKPKDFPHVRVKSDYSLQESDAICSVCHDGGILVLCDHCPSSFHQNCVGLEEVPEGKWFCPSCRCGICGISDFNCDTERFTEKTVLYCDQCELEYHVGCLKRKGLKGLEGCPLGNWFCSRKCSKIFHGLRKLLGKSNPTAVEGLSWTLLRSSRANGLDFAEFDVETIAEHHSKLSVALEVLHECFVTMLEHRTQSDLVADLLFNKESELKRLNFWGFYTMLLERGDELISVATFRVYGEKVAEMPLVGTRVQYRRQGMCRLVMDELEKLLSGLGVERLLLPAVPQLFETWTGSFGFTKMTSSDRSKFLNFTLLNFQDTTMCQKLLTTASKEPRRSCNQLTDSPCGSTEEMDCGIVSEVMEMVEPIQRLPSLDVERCSLPEKGDTVEENRYLTDVPHSSPTSSSSGQVGLARETKEAMQSEMNEQIPVNVTPGKCRDDLVLVEMPTPTVEVKPTSDIDYKFSEKYYEYNGETATGSLHLVKSIDIGSFTFKYFYKRRVLAK